jgi:hypothetical protein
MLVGTYQKYSQMEIWPIFRHPKYVIFHGSIKPLNCSKIMWRIFRQISVYVFKEHVTAAVSI